MERQGEGQQTAIDLFRLIRYMLKYCWAIILAVVIGAGGMYWYYSRNWVPTYTASATLYVVNSNPNLINYEYISSSDLNTAVQLLDTYMVVIRSNAVMNRVMDSLATNEALQGWPLSAEYVSSTLSMGTVNNTGVMRIACTTADPLLSREICNTVVDIAPNEIKRVVGAGSVEVVDYATLPLDPNSRGGLKKALLGAIAGAVLACGILLICFLCDHRVKDEKDLTDQYTVPLLASVMRMDEETKAQSKKRGASPHPESPYLIGDHSGDNITESYKNLRTNLRFSLMGQEGKVIAMTSAMPSEGKSTVSANLAIAIAQDQRKVLLIDGDMRRPSQHRIFGLESHRDGLSTVLLGNVSFEKAVRHDVRPGLDLLPVGLIPPNPSEMMNSTEMRNFLAEMEERYDMIIMDVPPINAVTDALVLSDRVAGLVFIVREKFSDHREIRRALRAVARTNANLLGFVLSGVEMSGRSYYQRKHYYRYYNRYYGHYHHDAREKAQILEDWKKAGQK